jgi:hypothetical protein
VELWLFLGLAFIVLIVLAWHNGAFQRRGSDDPDGRGAFPQIQPGGRGGESIRDPRAQLDAGDRLGGRGPGHGAAE